MAEYFIMELFSVHESGDNRVESYSGGTPLRSVLGIKCVGWLKAHITNCDMATMVSVVSQDGETHHQRSHRHSRECHFVVASCRATISMPA